MLSAVTGPGDSTVHALHEALDLHSRRFEQRFGGHGRPRLFFSPGRVNLMGAHLDYNGGPVLPTAVDRGTFVAARPLRAPILRCASTHEAESFEFDLRALPRGRLGAWVDYPLGVVAALSARDPQRSGAGIELMFGGNLPIGAGLSSSASICVGTALALDAMWELGLGLMDRVELALHAEREFVGVQCGIMDPYAVGLARPGHLLWLDCKDRSSEHVPFDTEACRLAVVDSGVRRELAAGEFNRRVAQCRAAFVALQAHQPGATCLRDIEPRTLAVGRAALTDELARRVEHVVHEVARTFDARRALFDGDLERFAARMLETHASLRDLFEVSCPELDLLVDIAPTVPGCLGGRLTGAGFGGCCVFLVRPGAEEELRARLREGFEARFGRAPRVEFYSGDEGPRELPSEAAAREF